MNSALDYMSIDHIMICVPNYEETLQWYQEKLDATIEKEWLVDELPDLKLAYLNIHGFRLEVVASTQAQKGMPIASDFGESLRTTGIGHFCFRVDDVDAALAEMNQRDVPTFVKAADYPNVGHRVGFVKDINGNIIEFAGPLKGI
ncbi:VOC family protein [Pleurocapsales cyanobacterium LEGE 06147]|nr:VOC family protein [Pleurocapsales cyanobacterium LEGE 06147]